jgi:hypothetical protein
LRECIDLVVVPSSWERAKFSPKDVKPWGEARQEDGTRLDLAGLVVHAHDFVSHRINANGMDVFARKILN